MRRGMVVWSLLWQQNLLTTLQVREHIDHFSIRQISKYPFGHHRRRRDLS